MPGDADHARDFAEVPEGNHRRDEQRRVVRELSGVPDIPGKWAVGSTGSHPVLPGIKSMEDAGSWGDLCSLG